jgi:hypothetical protein
MTFAHFIADFNNYKIGQNLKIDSKFIVSKEKSTNKLKYCSGVFVRSRDNATFMFTPLARKSQMQSRL